VKATEDQDLAASIICQEKKGFLSSISFVLLYHQPPVIACWIGKIFWKRSFSKGMSEFQMVKTCGQKEGKLKMML